MSRKETDSEREAKLKWEKVSESKSIYNDSLLPESDVKPEVAPRVSAVPAEKPMRPIATREQEDKRQR